MEKQKGEWIPQDCPQNILWKLFRIGVEAEKLPDTMTARNLQYIKEKVTGNHHE